MTYAQTLEYLFSQLPMYSRIGSAAYKADLDNTLALSVATGNPEREFKSIHVAGTNGKGSSSHMLASVLQTAGYRTGLYTSPHLKSFRERIRINGQEISEEFVVRFVQQYRPVFEKLQPSFFEMTVAMAFRYFADEKVDVAVVEVGLGGRLDSTNIITPEVSLITNISFDHMALLGKTLPEIASEKAGIIKSGVPVVISQTQPEVEEVFLKKAQSHNSQICFADQRFQTNNPRHTGTHFTIDVIRDGQLYLENLELDLQGDYQQQNILGVLQTLELLKKQGFAIEEPHIRKGLRNVTANTGLKGRWQIISTQPLTICDTAHNADGLARVLDQINTLGRTKVHFVYGTVNDKDISAILEMLPKTYTYYFCQPQIPRALPLPELVATANKAGLIGFSYNSVNEALQAAHKAAGSNDLIFVGGSNFVVAEVDDL